MDSMNSPSKIDNADAKPVKAGSHTLLNLTECKKSYPCSDLNPKQPYALDPHRWNQESSLQNYWKKGQIPMVMYVSAAGQMIPPTIIFEVYKQLNHA